MLTWFACLPAEALRRRSTRAVASLPVVGCRLSDMDIGADRARASGVRSARSSAGQTPRAKAIRTISRTGQPLIAHTLCNGICRCRQTPCHAAPVRPASVRPAPVMPWFRVGRLGRIDTRHGWPCPDLPRGRWRLHCQARHRGHHRPQCKAPLSMARALRVRWTRSRYAICHLGPVHHGPPPYPKSPARRRAVRHSAGREGSCLQQTRSAEGGPKCQRSRILQWKYIPLS